jgi:hypothetical protein
MLNHSPRSRLISTSLLIFALTYASTGVGQSGRRVRKPSGDQPAQPTPTPTPTPTVSTDKQKPLLKFIVGIDRFDGFSGVPMTAYGGVLRNCADRLADSASVKVEVAQRDMSRSDAMDRAKKEKDAYVVWLQVRVNNMGSNRSGTLDNVSIEYTVFEPTTAKRITSGATYPSAQRKGNVVLGRRTSDLYNDELYNRAAREAAERILARFRIGLPRDRRF